MVVSPNRYLATASQESFCRYFPAKHGNAWCSSDILEALADFGLKAGIASCLTWDKIN